ncbi:hypothetical protein EGI22_09310 [Lacihabitans sp. LS3-19]|nr:hypothetical protein [Lacihabitans sp. LS3-19]
MPCFLRFRLKIIKIGLKILFYLASTCPAEHVEDRRYSSNGLPSKFAATNLKSFKGMLVISTSERKLK